MAPLPTTACPEPSLPFAQAPLRQRCATAAFTPLGETQTVPAHHFLPPTAKLVGTVWHTVPIGLEGSAPLAMLASLAPHLLRRPPEASIAPPFIASPFCDESYTVLGSFAFTASHSPPLGDAILPSTVRFFIVSRSSSGLLEAPHPAAT
ncbi:MAG: hypothetical protein KDN22_16815, partial [Verrucomicrobiae bacterium]|nr:hypothetical protein [Verrucomicrobiae bacterium]